MTLDTRVYVLDRISYREVFTKCAQLLGVTEEHRIEDEQDKTWANGERFIEPSNPWTIMTAPMQGLPAWLMLHYRQGMPYRTEAEAVAHDEDICNLPGVSWYDEESGSCDGSGHTPASWLEISFDTAYSYSDEQGRGCGDLHASLVAQLGQWLAERNVRWLWQNEFTGEVHSGAERLIDLCSGGFEASAWFRTTVLSAIEREIGGQS